MTKSIQFHNSLILYLFLMLLSVAVTAQTSKGSWLVGGGAGLNFNNQSADVNGRNIDLNKETTLSLLPGAGYFVSDGLAIGASLDYTTAWFKTADDVVEVTSTRLGFVPFVKYYHPSGVFGQASAGLGTINTNSESNGISLENSSNFFSWGLSLGYAIFLNDHVSLEPAVNYASVASSLDDPANDVTQISRDLQITVGFNIFLFKDGE